MCACVRACRHHLIISYVDRVRSKKSLEIYFLKLMTYRMKPIFTLLLR